MLGREPGLVAQLSGAVHWIEPWTVRDPGALVVKYRELFERLGGKFTHGDALQLEQGGIGWRLRAGTAWSRPRRSDRARAIGRGDLTRRLGYRLPLGVKARLPHAL